MGDITIMIDDNLPTVIECAEKGIKALLLDHPWNQTESLPTDVTRVFSWDEIVYDIG
jgi:uncharacterized HAD superfamily protein